jgi:hypothetical protein
VSEGKTQTREWGLTEEIQRLDQLAGIVLQAALAVVALATGVLVTVSDSEFQILAGVVACVCVVSPESLPLWPSVIVLWIMRRPPGGRRPVR